MKLLSLCMIVKNEEKSLPECLRYVKDVVDEIVIVDTGSEDGTVDVARRFTDKVYRFEWIDDFSAARNFSVDKATSRYVMWLDADDRVGEASCSNLLKIKKDLARKKELVSYSFKITNTLGGGRKESCFQMRLFPKVPGARFEGRVHEDVSLNLVKLGIPIIYDGSVEIVHSGYSDPEKNIEKARRNLRLLIMDFEERGTWVTAYSLGNTYLYLGEKDKALDFFLKSMTDEARRTSPFLYLYSAMKCSDLMFEMGKRGEAISLLEKACSEIKESDVGKVFLGKFYLMTGEKEKALSTLLSVNPGRLSLVVVPMDLDHVRGVYHMCLGDAYRVLGYEKLAFNSYRKAVRYLADAHDLLSVGKVLMEGSDYVFSEEAFEKALSFTTDREKKSHILTLISLCFLARGKEGEALNNLREAVSLNPENTRAALYLSDLLLGKGKMDEAIKLLEDGVGKSNGRKLSFLSRLSYAYVKLFMFDELFKITDSLVRELMPGKLVTLGSFQDLSRLYKDFADLASGLGDADISKYLLATSHEVDTISEQRGVSTDK